MVQLDPGCRTTADPDTGLKAHRQRHRMRCILLPGLHTMVAGVGIRAAMLPVRHGSQQHVLRLVVVFDRVVRAARTGCVVVGRKGSVGRAGRRTGSEEARSLVCRVVRWELGNRNRRGLDRVVVGRTVVGSVLGKSMWALRCAIEPGNREASEEPACAARSPAGTLLEAQCHCSLRFAPSSSIRSSGSVKEAVSKRLSVIVRNSPLDSCIQKNHVSCLQTCSQHLP